MKILRTVLVVLNLHSFEPLTPGEATKKASDDYGQVDGGAFCDADYGTDFITPSFKCYDDKEKYILTLIHLHTKLNWWEMK